MSDWNGKPISEMDTDHIRNTIKLLENRARTKYAIEEEETRDSTDEYRVQRFLDAEDWREYLHEAYFPLVKELERRGPSEDLKHNF